MSRRVYVEEISGSEVRIEDAEAHHLLHVLRITTGDTVELFDGRGQLAEARVQSVSRRHVDVTVVAVRTAPASQLPRLTVAAAPAKGDRLRWMIEKLTELGANELILLETARTIVSPGDTKLDKLRATVVNACKQSLRPRLMQLRGLTPLAALLNELSTAKAPSRLFLAHPPEDLHNSPELQHSSESESHFSSPYAATSPYINRSSISNATLLIGPEGGFTEAEVQSIRQISSPPIVMLHWPETILRIETAAVTFATLLLQR